MWALKKLIRKLKKLTQAQAGSKRVFSLITKLLQLLPASSELIGTPTGFYRSTSDWAKTFNLSENKLKGNYSELHTNRKVDWLEPISLDEEIHWKFKRAFQSEPESRPLFVATIPNGRVWTDSAILTPDDKLLADLSIEIGKTAKAGKSIEDHSIFSKWKLRPASPINGTAAALSVSGGQNYYHWMFEVLPRIGLINQSGILLDSIDKFIVNSCSSSFQRETLEILGIPATKIVAGDKISHVKANQLIVSSLLRGPDKFVLSCDFLRTSFLPHSTVDTLDQSNFIYISRATASYRQVLNELEVINYLSQFGFKAIALESMSVKEQVTAFASAKIIVAPHGAGLTNIVFCKPGTQLIEFFSPNYVNVCYWSISNYIGLKYYYLLGEGQRPLEYVDKPMLHPHQDNIQIDLNSLAKIFKLANTNGLFLQA